MLSKYIIVFCCLCFSSVVSGLDASSRAMGESLSAEGEGVGVIEGGEGEPLQVLMAEGATITLSLVVGAAWDRCYWFKHEETGEFDYCNFDYNTDLNKMELHRYISQII